MGDPGPLRRRLLLAFQAEPVGLRARSLLDAGLPRDDQLRSHQAALLHDAPAPQPVQDRPGRPAARLGLPASPGRRAFRLTGSCPLTGARWLSCVPACVLGLSLAPAATEL